MSTSFRPLHDYILVKRKDAEKVSAGGLYIPENKQAKSRYAEVLAVGPGKVPEGQTERRPVCVTPGQVVYFRGFAGQEVELDGESGYLILKEDDLEAVVEEP